MKEESTSVAGKGKIDVYVNEIGFYLKSCYSLK